MNKLKVSNQAIFISIFIVLFTKILLFLLFETDYLILPVGGGSDADYYDAFAKGYEDYTTSLWPIFLKFLSDSGFYSRSIISYVIFGIHLFLLPFLTTVVANLKFNKNQKEYFYCILLMLIYPTLFFYSMDIYRDTVMLLIFLLGCLTVRKYINTNEVIIKIFFFILSIVFLFLLYGFRPYLGFGFLMALIFWRIKLNAKKTIFLGFFYLLILFILNFYGYLDPLTKYREGFTENADVSSGSTLGIDFSDPVMFVPNFILSILGQLFGLFFVNPLSVLLWIIESLPFIFMFFYIIKNIRYANAFIRFLLVFFVAYGSVWLIGNDNLGTAVRLRMFNYIVVYICFFLLLGEKHKQLFSKK
ncbi:hypothetical protein [Acinetobacter sp. yr461]|uniref:hypothetical protein n=1 Tax=Acinetobacter sp. yr461 TaxID=1761742 RepID=UPI0008CE2B7B|nr:hypothetical protein [Acinetobacter sp. yr461]SEO84358.1 hypothetical protein SAMN04487817_12042 [Acinetobacter sp. yr461]